MVKREWGLMSGLGLMLLGLGSAPFWYSWTMHAFYPEPGLMDDVANKPWKPFARLALSSFMVVLALVLGALLIRVELRNRRS
jgi:hypothetical protein